MDLTGCCFSKALPQACGCHLSIFEPTGSWIKVHSVLVITMMSQRLPGEGFLNKLLFQTCYQRPESIKAFFYHNRFQLTFHFLSQSPMIPKHPNSFLSTLVPPNFILRAVLFLVFEELTSTSDLDLSKVSHSTLSYLFIHSV